MVVVIFACLVCIGRVEGDGFVNVGIAIPDAVTIKSCVRSSIGIICSAIRKGIAAIKHGNTIDKVSDRAAPGSGFTHWNHSRF